MYLIEVYMLNKKETYFFIKFCQFLLALLFFMPFIFFQLTT